MPTKEEMIKEIIGGHKRRRITLVLPFIKHVTIRDIYKNTKLRGYLSDIGFLPKRVDLREFIESHNTKEMIFILKNMGSGSTFNRFEQLEKIVISFRNLPVSNLKTLINFDRNKVNRFMRLYGYIEDKTDKFDIIEALEKV